MAYPFVGAGGTLGVNFQDTYATADAVSVFGFAEGSTVIGVDGYSYVFTKNGGTAIAPGTAGAPAKGVPANHFYWDKAINHRA